MFILYTLCNLPPHLNSSLMNIHFISLLQSHDAKNCGIDKMLTPFVEEVKVLKNNGMKVSFADQPVNGTIAQVTGDRSELGFVKSFTANYYCRMCLINLHKQRLVKVIHMHRRAQVRAIVAQATACLPSVAELPLWREFLFFFFCCCVYINTISP